jgi:hypothetical protein
MVIKIWKISAIFSVFFFFIACKSKNESEPISRIEIDLDKIRIEKIEDVLVESDTILLEATSASLIKSIVRISFVNDKIFIWDSQKLLVFSKIGTFLGNIGTKGQASNEFTALSDYFICNDTVFLYDFNGRKILKYEIGGNYISYTPIEQPFNRICPLPNNTGYIVLNTFSNRKDNPKFKWMDYDFKVKHSSREQLLHGSSFSNTFFRNEDFLVYWEMFHNTIYSVTGDRVDPKYVVDFMRYAIPPNIDDIPKITEYYTKNSSKVAGMINSVIETEAIVAFMFAHDMAYYWALVDKNSKNVRIFRLSDVNDSFGILNSIATYHDGWFYGIYTPDELHIGDNYSLIRFKIQNL